MFLLNEKENGAVPGIVYSAISSLFTDNLILLEELVFH
jgi:hypothetical protein